MTHNKPHPIGYVEIQRVWDGPLEPTAPMMAWAGADAHKEAETNAGCLLKSSGSRVEHIGRRTIVYYGFEPVDVRPPPLNPHNLNAAEQFVLGQLIDPNRDGALNLGAKEKRFPK